MGGRIGLDKWLDKAYYFSPRCNALLILGAAPCCLFPCTLNARRCTGDARSTFPSWAVCMDSGSFWSFDTQKPLECSVPAAFHHGDVALKRVIGQARAGRVLAEWSKKTASPTRCCFGTSGTGAVAAALEFVQALHCRAEGAVACGRCPSCQKVAHLNHPDNTLLFPFSRRVKEDDMQAALRRSVAIALSLSPARRQRETSPSIACGKCSGSSPTARLQAAGARPSCCTPNRCAPKRPMPC